MASAAARERMRLAMKARANEASNSASASGGVQSPLARRVGSELQCVACGSRVRSSAAWPAHVNSRAHKARLQQLRDQLAHAQPAAQPTLSAQSLKRAAPSSPPPDAPPAKLRSILKNSQNPGSKSAPESPVEEAPMQLAPVTERVPSPDVAVPDKDETLPEGFFDDPKMDAKARNIPHKDPIEEEWEKFQRAMKEETNLSAAIIAGEQEEATAERQIDEIEEQIRNLSRVLDLNRKKEEAAKQKKAMEIVSSNAEELATDDEEEFEEYLDWRAKKSYR